MPDAFEVTREGERVSGLARGIDRRHLARLRRGEIAPESEIDLHGLSSAEARRDLAEALRECVAEGVRCLLVIHGRGRGSEAGPVLRDAVIEALTTPPLAALVLAFASAQSADGGAGATYALLRRERQRTAPR